MHYPNSPGFKAPGPSLLAAKANAGRAETLREQVLETLSGNGPKTADECAALMRESILSIRPRFSELLASGKIEDSKIRRKNVSGHTATVWQVCKPKPEIHVQPDLLCV